MKKPAIKICGLRTIEAMETALKAGVNFAGLVFYDRSSRFVSSDQAAALAKFGQGRIKAVGLFVDAEDSYIEFVTQRVGLDFIQLHGDESPSRVQAIRQHFGLPVIKAIKVAAKTDLDSVNAYEAVADWLLFDAKVMGQQGGTGTAFDWSLLKQFRSSRPWMLSGGLNVDNVGIALAQLQPDSVDVSSGVEDAPDIKSVEKITRFVEAVTPFQRN